MECFLLSASARNPGPGQSSRSRPLAEPGGSAERTVATELSQPNQSSQSRDEGALGERYSRQILFPGIGLEGQQQLGLRHVAIVGVGATGAVTASLLARAGVGRLTVIDRDFVEPSNLQRQILYDEEDARQSLPKAEAAKQHLRRVNSSVEVEAHVADLTPSNAETLLGPVDLVLDCTDNYETRYLINDLCVRDGKPWIYAAAVGAYAAGMNVLPRWSAEEQGSGPRAQVPDSKSSGPWSLVPGPLLLAPTACLACIFPEPPTGPVETCDTAGILSPAVNLAASIQVAEALKFLTGHPELMRRTLVGYELWTNTDEGRQARSEMSTSTPRAGCEVCGQRIFRHLAGEGRPTITLCGRNSVQIHEHQRPVDLHALAKKLEASGRVRTNGHLLRFDRPPHSLTVFPDGRALVQGTTDPGLARSLYARFVGA
jgi:molybdopterin/thiamine biosynthesis adenylyltransferase